VGGYIKRARLAFQKHQRILSMADWAQEMYKPHCDALESGQRVEDEPPLPDYKVTNPIHNLILMAKSPHTVSALLAVKHRLKLTSSVLFIGNYHILRTARLLLAEISLILRSLPEIQSYANLETRFSPDRLERMVLGAAARQSEKVHSMA
jgi:hypothetical protein